MKRQIPIPKHLQQDFIQSISTQEYWRTFLLKPTVKLKDIAWELATSFLCNRLSVDECEELCLDYITGAVGGAHVYLKFEINILNKTAYIIDIINCYLKTGELNAVRGDTSTINAFMLHINSLEKELAKDPLSYDYGMRLNIANSTARTLMDINVILKASEVLSCLMSNVDHEYLRANIMCDALLNELQDVKPKETLSANNKEIEKNYSLEYIFNQYEITIREYECTIKKSNADALPTTIRNYMHHINGEMATKLGIAHVTKNINNTRGASTERNLSRDYSNAPKKIAELKELFPTLPDFPPKK